ncbi:DUF3566 domain-containing protein [Nocardia sp. CDC159]|uniref:DUF3566 domain-containing protein n=1 Tax=Nocardia pulmonis TaxID=2951408 RepID=A0A9X2J0F3_9NOCA|nr:MULTISPECIES: DUF3566 domain-containing protein [Nocardia]MCM6776965.1 DUF3566 domain-containing protein [Nocardia pulmonis]MCM6789389.1 DUF3566 domain-containing protein [Nocardia sp. CDC159]
MTTPNQPNDERHHANGVTERIAPSPIPPRPIPRPGASGDNGQGNAPEMSDKPSDPKAAKAQEGRAEAPESAEGGAARFEEGWSQLPQREPQSNLNRPGQAPVAGRPPANPVGLNTGGGLGGGVSNARTTADLAAKAARKEAAMVKSVGIDGPTRSIARPELVKDMPDLSELRHPLPPTAEVPGAHGPQAVPISPAVPVAVAQAVTTGEPLRATVQVRHIDPWSTLKVSLVISVAMFFVWMLAVGFLYIVLSGMGVWDRLNSTFTDMVSDNNSSSTALIDAGTVFGYAAVVGIINVVLLTALSTVGVFIYNQCTDLVGGIQVTLADPD